MEKNLLLAIVVVAAIALVARILINKHKSGSIAWRKLGFIGVMMMAFAITYFTFDPYSAKIWWNGKASLSDAKIADITGREAADDIPHYASDIDANKGRYYVIDTKMIEPTGFYVLKSSKDLDNAVERTEEMSKNDKKVIKRRTSLIEITRNPGERIDKYVPVYKVTLANKGEVMACMQEDDAERDVLPVAMLKPMSESINSVIERLESEKSELITEYYFNLHNTTEYNKLVGYNNLIYKFIAGLVTAIIVAVIYNLVGFKKKKL
jgi:uncharacterized membrane protein YeaQ/YmgE (transglycosylase-associated protein family)